MTTEPIAAMPRSLDEIAAAHDSVADRTPSTVLKAFVPEPVMLSGRALKPLTLRTWMLLEKIKSPFLSSDGGDSISLSSLLPTLLVLLHDAEWVAQVIAQGEQAIAAECEKLAGQIPLRELPAMAQAISAHIAAEFAPSASLARPSKDGESPLSVSAPGTAAEAP
jgi:hypothetical protein